MNLKQKMAELADKNKLLEEKNKLLEQTNMKLKDDLKDAKEFIRILCESCDQKEKIIEILT